MANDAFPVRDAGPPPDDTRAPGKGERSKGWRRRTWRRTVIEILVLGALIAFGWFERTTVSQSVGVVGRAEWGWLLVLLRLNSCR